MPSNENKKTILVVDDEADIRDVLEISLADSGYDVWTAENGTDALTIFKEQRPPIVLTDIKMPHMDGIELLRNIKYEDHDTEVIMITGHGDMALAIESLKHEATDFIVKPINVNSLEIALKRANERIIMRQKLREYTENLETLLREKTELQDHLSSLGLMIGSISHSVKGLLTGLDGGMYLLNSGFAMKNQEKIKEGLGIVKKRIERIRKMILNILFYAKERSLNLEKVDLHVFTDDVVSMMMKKSEEHGIETQKVIDPYLESLEADPDLLQSAIINILENALDACIEDDAKKNHQIVFSVKKEKGYIVFEVSDNGIGMNDETREKIFKLFFSSKEREGTGLGLFITDKIIKQHGGHISVTSSFGKGTSFSIKIPEKIPNSLKHTTYAVN